MNHKLMAKEVKINPVITASSFFTALIFLYKNLYTLIGCLLGLLNERVLYHSLSISVFKELISSFVSSLCSPKGKSNLIFIILVLSRETTFVISSTRTFFYGSVYLILVLGLIFLYWCLIF